MKIRSSSSKQSHRWLVAAALVLMLTGAFAAYFFLNPSGSSGPSANEKATGETIKENSLQPVSDDNDTPRGNGSDPLPDPTPSEDGKPTVEMDITSVSQDDSTLQIRTVIKTVSNTGSCRLVMEHVSGFAYKASVAVQALASSTTCKGFDLPLADIRSGDYKVTITYENDSVQSQTTKEISVQ